LTFLSFDLDRDLRRGKQVMVESLSSASCDGRVGSCELGDLLTFLAELGDGDRRFVPTGSYPPVSGFSVTLFWLSIWSVLSG